MQDNARSLRHLEARVQALEFKVQDDVIVLPRVLEMIALLAPSRVERPLVRIGRSHMDGGYLVVDDFEGLSRAVSLGIADDVSADLDLVQRGCVVDCYDPSIPRLPVRNSALRFFREGVSTETRPDMIGLGAVLARLPASEDAFLKCDIEHHEWSVFAAATPDQLSRFRQIVVEFHGLDQIDFDEWWNTAKQALSNLRATHHVVHAHASNYFPLFSRAGIQVPRIVEVTYLRGDRCESAVPTSFALSPLDVPHDAGYPETDLGVLWNELLGDVRSQTPIGTEQVQRRESEQGA